MFEIVINFFPARGKPKKPTDDKTKEFDPLGYWTMAKKELLSNPKQFLRDLIEFDKDHIPEATIATVKPKLEWEEVTEKKVASASGALVPVRMWANAMVTYHEVLKIVNPKRAIAAEMTAKLDGVMKNLNEKRAQVKAIDDKLGKLAAEQKALEDKS